MVLWTSATLAPCAHLAMHSGRLQPQAGDALLFLKNLRSIALYVREDGATAPKLLYRMRISVPDVRSIPSTHSSCSLCCLVGQMPLGIRHCMLHLRLRAAMPRAPLTAVRRVVHTHRRPSLPSWQMPANETRIRSYRGRQRSSCQRRLGVCSSLMKMRLVRMPLTYSG